VGLGSTDTIHLRLIENRVEDFLLVLIERFSVVRPSVCRLSVTFVHPILRLLKFSAMFLRHLVPWPSVFCDLSIKILRRSCQGNPFGEGLNQRGSAKYSDFGRFQGYISETVQDRSYVSINY